MLKVELYNSVPTDIEMRFVVIVCKHDGKWVFVRHKERNTFEIPGGHIENGEDAVTAAKRELFEETGAIEFSLDFVGSYAVFRDANGSGGYLFFADIQKFSELPDFEMAEMVLYERFPDFSELTYPEIQPFLFNKVQDWLNLQNNKDEIWDVYDKNRVLTGRVHRRGDPLAEGEYHLVVHVWIVNSSGEFLITKRTPNKGYPNMWECTGGSAISGNDSLQAAIREAKEETGLELLSKNGKVLFSLNRNDNFCDVWLFQQDFDINDVVFQPDETCGAKWADKNEIKRMVKSGEFIEFCYMEELFGILGE